MTLPPQAQAERQSWLTRVRDALNARGILVAACDLKKRTCGEVLAAEQWANGPVVSYGDIVSPPAWLRPFVKRVANGAGETLLETRRRARAECRGAA